MAEPRIIVMGSFVADLMGRGAELPVPGETVKGAYFKVGPGGKGANQAVAAARAGGDVAMITQLGNDAFGEMAIANFTAEGIDTKYIFRSQEHSTGAALIMVKEGSGQNAIMVIPGACGNMAEDDVVAAMKSLGRAEVLVLQLETNFEAFAVSLRTGREMGMKIVCNPAPAQPLPAWCYPLIDYLTPNETEAAALSGIRVESVEDARAAAQKLRGMGAKNVIITLGEKGCLVLAADGREEFVRAFEVAAVDTTGAGDAFNGAFALALAEGRNIVDSATFAAAAAALSVTKIGTAPAMAYRDEIDALMKKSGHH